MEEARPGIDRLTVLEAIMPWLQDLSDLPSLTLQECEEYRRYDWLDGRRVLEPVAGEPAGIDQDGALLIHTASGVERIVGGGVVTA